MSNLLRSDLYRLFKSKSFYICMAVEACLFILGMVIIYLMNQTEPAIVTLEAQNGIDYGLTALTTSDITLLLGIIIGIFVTAEFSHGTMKNVVSKGFSKVNIYLSKLVTMVIATFIFMLFILIVGVIGATILTGNLGELSGENVLKIFQIIGIEMLLYTALASLYLMFSMVLRNLGGVIAINIIYASIVERLFFSLLQLIAKDKIEFSKYSLFNNISFYSIGDFTGSDLLRSAVVAIVVLAVTTALGIFAFTKTDVK